MVTVGRIVHYTLTQEDADQVDRRRADFVASPRPHSGHQAHVGNVPGVGDVYPAMTVRVDRTWSPPSVNLQVFLDGNDVLWKTSIPEGDGPGHWCWPPRV